MHLNSVLKFLESKSSFTCTASMRSYLISHSNLFRACLWLLIFFFKPSCGHVSLMLLSIWFLSHISLLLCVCFALSWEYTMASLLLGVLTHRRQQVNVKPGDSEKWCAQSSRATGNFLGQQKWPGLLLSTLISKAPAEAPAESILP